jgi:hypothetical protein
VLILAGAAQADLSGLSSATLRLDH